METRKTTQLGFKNFRTFTNYEELDLKPVTLLLGGNGTGKSSIVRLFPMIKQTAEAKARGFLWYGNLVDFGNFNDIKSKKSPDDFFELSFNFKIPKAEIYFTDMFSKLEKNNVVKFKMTFRESSKALSYLNVFEASINSDNVVVSYDENSNFLNYVYNNVDCSEFFQKGTDLFMFPITPKFISIKPNEKSNYPFLSFETKKNEKAIDEVKLPILRLKILEKIYQISNKKKFNVNEVSDYTYSFSFIDYQKQIKSLLEDFFISQKDTKKIAKILDIDSFDKATLALLTELHFLLNIDDYSAAVRFSVHAFNSIGREIRYIGPIRSTIDRYYRQQELNLSDISHDGKNLALYLNSLSQAETNSLNKWLKQFFDFQIFSENIGSHVELKILEADSSEKINLADTGFGYSQLLPIVIQIWSLDKKNDLSFNYPQFENVDLHVVLEQPELHLHPLLQSKFADALIDTIEKFKVKNINVIFIIETHSEALLDRFRELVLINKFQQNDMAIYFTEKDKKSHGSIRKCKFNQNGEIENWPVGFFSGVAI